MSRETSVSLCMIVRDEEEFLGPCLEAAQPHVDEIVIVDTGSKDATVEIARKWGARVFCQPWRDNFSAARNFSIEQARGDWILVLDADERISSRAGRDFRKLIQDPACICVSFLMTSTEGDHQQSQSLMTRAFRRRPDIRYRYRIHEQVLPDIQRIVREEGLSTGRARGDIRHAGYLPEVMLAKSKDARNRRLYGLQLQETPNDLYMLYKYGDFLRRFEDAQEQSFELLNRAYRILQELQEETRASSTFGGQICALLGEALQHRGQTRKALLVTTFGCDHCQVTGDLFYVHGNNALLLGDGAAAEEAFHRCQELSETAGAMVCLPRISGLGATLGLARARQIQGWEEEALELVDKALREHPDSALALDLWSELMAGNQAWPELMRHLIATVQEQPCMGTAWLWGGRVLQALGLHKKALPWLLRAAELTPDPAQAWSLAGESFLRLGFAEKAMEAFERGLPGMGSRAGLVVLQLLCGIDPETPLASDDEELLARCATLLRAILTEADHPFQKPLEEAHIWVGRLESGNAPFFSKLLCALPQSAAV